MSIIAVRSGVARMVLDVRPGEAREALEIIEGTSRQALREMRLLVGVLRDADADNTHADRGSAPGLASLAVLITHIGQAGVPVGVRVEGQARALSPGVDLSAYRIIQEALTNVVRHAAPATAELTLRYSPDEVVIEVTDNGRNQLKTLSPASAGKNPDTGLRECASGWPSTAAGWSPSRLPRGSKSWPASRPNGPHRDRRRHRRRPGSGARRVPGSRRDGRRYGGTRRGQ